MTYLLDTCVISEFRKKQPAPEVIGWLNQIDPETAYLSVVTIGEVKKGIEKLADTSRQVILQAWLDHDLLGRFEGRIVTLDSKVLLVWGTLVARLEKSGKSMPMMDSLIAATALHDDFTLVTRNEADFAHTGVKLFNPWP